MCEHPAARFLSLQGRSGPSETGARCSWKMI
ncbi:hypothetical protein FOXB_08772 [Fusarium oxysporum f. sp. conglutinans Fo5176]|uniref:Uncharacterized protein n=1 Tax=Fusarium oxysporum (strain Fo5176) TaxID=660025 RepID=F9FQU2_FUSOF|nr:hypothetical protein FOXB_08772 [Fusarium oxysporum f. sp. conglutinans Fo5176]